MKEIETFKSEALLRIVHKKIALKDPLERGMGLAAMDERARMFGCFLEISTEEGKGTRISLIIPTNKRRTG